MTLQSEKKRMAYFLSQYPAISHTFFLKEILGLRQLGFEIEVASVNPPDRTVSELPPVEAQEAASTYCLKLTTIWEAICVVVTMIFVYPAAFIRGARVALTMGGWDLVRKIYAFFYTVEAFLLGRWMKKRSLRHLHVHFGGSVATVAMVAAEIWKFDYSLTIHGPEEFYEVDYCYLPRKIERAKFIFCISDFCQSQLMKYCDPAHWDKMHVVRLGVDVGEFKPASHESDLPPQIVCVGRLVPAKGQHILLRAFSLLHAKGHAGRLIFVGSGPDMDSLKREAAANGMGEHVIFRGALNHEQTRQQLQQADIFALASFAEGIPVALMEAMAMAIPCVTTNVAGIPELIRDDVDGFLVPASSVESMASAIESLLVNGDLRARLGASARARVTERYNLADNLKVLASTFEICFRS